MDIATASTWFVAMVYISMGLGVATLGVSYLIFDYTKNKIKKF